LKRRSIAAWIVYDIAVHGYGLMIPAVGFAIYFTSFVAAGHPFADGLWSLAVAIPLIAAGLLGPWLGAVADSRGRRRSLLAGATLICAAASALMVTLGQGDIVAGMLLFIVAQLAYLLATALYNSYLPQISTPQTSARVSGMAWGLSYLGGIVCFLLCLPFIRAGVVAGNEGYFANAFLVTAGFLLTLGTVSILGLPADIKGDRRREETNAYQRIWNTVRSWRKDREIPKFLLAYYLINDAMVTVLYFTAIFLKATFGLNMQEILILSLAFQLIAIPSTIFFGWLGDRWSQFGAVNVTLMIWVVVLALMGMAVGEHAPLAIAITLGLVLGSTQSLLRSMYSQMVPPERAGEYFGFHSLAGRASSALGPLLFGAVSAVTGNQRIAMMSLGVFLLAGAILLARVQAEIRRMNRPSFPWHYFKPTE
jgi:MFS transporter, UMF1 family